MLIICDIVTYFCEEYKNNEQVSQVDKLRF